MVKRLTTIWLLAICVLAGPQAADSKALAGTPLQDAIARLTPQQQARLKAYETARAGFQRRTDQYWHQIEVKRRKRKAKLAAGKAVTVADYVKTQPPVYKGPARPDDVMALLPKPEKPPIEQHEPVAVVADFLHHAEEIYGFRPDRVSEDEFMISYAIEAVRLGLT